MCDTITENLSLKELDQSITLNVNLFFLQTLHDIRFWLHNRLPVLLYVAINVVIQHDKHLCHISTNP